MEKKVYLIYGSSINENGYSISWLSGIVTSKKAAQKYVEGMQKLSDEKEEGNTYRYEEHTTDNYFALHCI